MNTQLNKDNYDVTFPCGKYLAFTGERTRNYHMKLHTRICPICKEVSLKDQEVQTTYQLAEGNIKRKSRTPFT